MQGYTSFKKKKGKLGTTLLIVAAVHLAAGGGLVWLASTTAGREILAVYKVDIIPEILNINRSKAPKPVGAGTKADRPDSQGPASSTIVAPKAEAPPPEAVASSKEAPSPSSTPAGAGAPAVSDLSESSDSGTGSEPEGSAASDASEAASSEPGGEGFEPGRDGGPSDGDQRLAMVGPGGPGGGGTGPGGPGIGPGPGMVPGGSGLGPGPGGPASFGQGSAPTGPGGGVRLPGSGSPFASGGGGGGKGNGKKFGGYSDLVTSEIQKHYRQPSELPTDLPLAALFQIRLDEEGRIVEFKLMNSSGNPLFDESALQALSNIKRLRPPPQGMSKTLTVKFFPPAG